MWTWSLLGLLVDGPELPDLAGALAGLRYVGLGGVGSAQLVSRTRTLGVGRGLEARRPV
jgi:hypothetical protein